MLRYLVAPLVGGAVAVVLVGCSGGGSNESAVGPTATQAAQESGSATGDDAEVEALRTSWAATVDEACRARASALASVARDLPATIERGGFKAGGQAVRTSAEDALAAMGEAELASGDEELGAEFVDSYGEAWALEARAVAAPYKQQDRRFFALMEQASAARADANALVGELGVTTCGDDDSGPYASTNAYAAVRWGMRASEFCRVRDTAFRKLRSTDLAGFDRVSAEFLAHMQTLAQPEPYTRRIKRLLREYAAQVDASKRGDFDTSNRLSEETTTLLYDLGFDIGYTRFCSVAGG